MLSTNQFQIAAWVVLAISCSDTAGPQPATIDARLEKVAQGLSFPVDLAAPKNDSRLFIVEKSGKIRIVKDGNVLPAAFLDISSLVSTGSEQGLLGLAFHPDYAQNGMFIVDYTDTSGDTRIARYHVSSNPDVADAASGVIVLTVDQPYSNHNGGGIAFGPDEYLYIALGDGGSGGDPQGHGQDRSELLGSLLRIDVANGNPYNIPASNPYAGSTSFRPEIWSYGLRNPWRFSFDRQTGDLYIGDVGQGEREEIDVAPASSVGGENYGWRIMEGRSCYGSSSCNQGGLVLPVFDYTHSDGCSVTGGYVYRGQAVPALAGIYFYSDYCSGWIRSFRYVNGRATESRSWSSLDPHGSVTSFGQDAEGEIYVLVSDGTVYRIAP